ncbi:MAG: potassium-transporting ATPase subunit F [Saprospiraceae bacterium]|nr:potassium-transporting ATPase subunit F [Saprospiraceae bacterium]
MPFFTKLLNGLKKSKIMTLLFIIAIGVFAYMCYVLLKPEKF